MTNGTKVVLRFQRPLGAKAQKLRKYEAGNPLPNLKPAVFGSTNYRGKNFCIKHKYIHIHQSCLDQIAFITWLLVSQSKFVNHITRHANETLTSFSTWQLMHSIERSFKKYPILKLSNFLIRVLVLSITTCFPENPLVLMTMCHGACLSVKWISAEIETHKELLDL